MAGTVTSTSPAVSVVIPVYNASRYVAAAIESVLSQDLVDIEVIVIDDGSTDTTPEILAGLAHQDGRVEVLSQPNRGLVTTLNRGVEHARGALIARMDADDICLPGRLAAQIQAFDGRTDLAVLGGFTELIDEDGRYIRQGRYPVRGRAVAEFIERGSPVAHPAVMMRRDVFDAVGGYRAAFRHAEDYDLWLRIHDRGYAIENLPFPVLAYRVHGTSISMRRGPEQALGTLVARLAHQIRVSGHDDSITDGTVLDEQLVLRLSSQLSGDHRAEYLEALYMNVSHAEAAAIEAAVDVVNELPRSSASRGPIARMLLRAANGFLRRGRRMRALRAAGRAFLSSPRASFSLVAEKIAAGRSRRAGTSGTPGAAEAVRSRGVDVDVHQT